MSVTEPEFRRALADFVSRVDQLGKTERWTLHKSEIGICAKQSVMIKFGKEAVNRQVHVTYNSTYGVPVLWFNFYRRDGTPLTNSEIMELSSKNGSSEIAQYISLNEHPILGVLFYNIHPCKTKDIMNELNGKGNYIARWLSVYGAPIGVLPPDALFNSKSLSQRSEDASQSSDDGSLSTLEM
ncbi:Autophagocytosis associated protein [Trichostrongylus colubriformis]|uniref:Ubiquitin-like-conjugating enzyme ATG10 n=1 Tax=Trichostrongylus colubriformis TaxID=6319 RepID=A0AAN8F3Y8_TRICO